MTRTTVYHSGRRLFLQRLGAVLGATTVATLTSGMSLNVALAYQPQTNSASKAGQVFSLSQMQILAQIVDTILPRTETLGAIDLDCHGFVDHQLANCFSKQETLTYLSAVDLFDASFIALSADAKNKMLTALEKGQGVNEQQLSQFKALKSLIVFGYFTSEYGASTVLRYDPVPGGFKSIPYQAGDKSWGSRAYY